MTTLELRAPGASRLGAHLEDAATALPGEVDDALADFAATWLGVAVRMAPHATGRLAESQTITRSRGEVTVTATVPYAVPVYARNPWLARARAAVADDAAREVQSALDRVAAQITGA